MNEEVLKTLTPSTRKAIEAMAGTPGDCVHFYNQLAIQRAGIRIGAEVMQHQLLAKAQAARAAMAAVPGTKINMAEAAELGALERAYESALSVAASLECAMSLLELVHGKDIFKASATTPEKEPPSNGNRIRHLDLDGG